MVLIFRKFVSTCKILLDAGLKCFTQICQMVYIYIPERPNIFFKSRTSYKPPHCRKSILKSSDTVNFL